MKIGKSNSGLIIGAIFTGVSLLLTVTFIVPIISVSPGIIFEAIAKKLINNEPYSNVGKLTILLLGLIFLLTLILCLMWIRKTVTKGEQISKGRIIGVMLLIYFIVHPLLFYIYWGVALNFRSDGQLIFRAIKSFPISSFVFVLIGLSIDKVKNKGLANSIQRNE